MNKSNDNIEQLAADAIEKLEKMTKDEFRQHIFDAGYDKELIDCDEILHLTAEEYYTCTGYSYENPLIDEFKPDWATPPGSTIDEILEERSLSHFQFAKFMDIPIECVDPLLRGHLMIGDELADKLGMAFGPNKEFWLQREKQFRKSLNRLQEKLDNVAE